MRQTRANFGIGTLAGDPARAFARHRFRVRRAQAAHRDLQARDALFSGDCRRRAGTHGGREGGDFGAQRLGMADRQVASKLTWCREPEVRTTIAASPIANFGFEAALES